MSELTKAIERIDGAQLGGESLDDEPEYRAVELVTNTARLVANPNIDAARDSVDMPAVVLLLWRIMELMGVGVAEFPERDTTGFAMMIRDAIVNQELFAAAFTRGDTE